MRNKIDLYSRISVAIVLAFLTSQLLVQEVFLSYSPSIRPDLADRVVETSLAFVNIDNYRNFFAGQREERTDFSATLASNETEALDHLGQVNFTPTIIRGVYAKETGNAALYRINVKEIDWVEIFYEKKDGTIERIKIPRGTQPPPPGMF